MIPSRPGLILTPMVYCGLRRLQPLSVSTVQVGLAYELLVVRVLQQYCFQLVHSGRSGDRGLDFFGHWLLPDRKVPVVGQCKCHRRPLSPRDVREFQSVLQRYLPEEDGTGMIISHSGFSTKAVETFQSCRLPLILCQIKPRLATTSFPDAPQVAGAQWSGNKTIASINSVHTNTADEKNREAVSKGQNSEEERHHMEESPVLVSRQGKGVETRLVASASSENGTVLLSGKHDTETSDGYVEDFVMNRQVRRLLPCVTVTWRHHIGAGGSELLLHYTQTDTRQ